MFNLALSQLPLSHEKRTNMIDKEMTSALRAARKATAGLSG